MAHPVLTPRDLDLFRFLHSYSMLKTSDVARRFFPNIAPTTMFRRLRRLEGQGFLARMHGFPGGELAWRVTEKGAKRVAETPPRRYFPKQTLEHDAQVVDIRLALEAAGMAHSWIPEHVLRRQLATKYDREGSSFKVVPDGMMGCEFQGEMSTVAIELELHQKNKSRYERTFRNYCEDESLIAIWYLVQSAEVGKSINRIFEKHGVFLDAYFLWSLASEVQNDPLTAFAYSGENKYPLTRLFLPLKQPPAPEAPAHPPAHAMSSVEPGSPSDAPALTAEDSSENAAPALR